MKKLLTVMVLMAVLIAVNPKSDLTVPGEVIRVNSEPVELAVPGEVIRVNSFENSY